MPMLDHSLVKDNLSWIITFINVLNEWVNKWMNEWMNHRMTGEWTSDVNGIGGHLMCFQWGLVS